MAAPLTGADDTVDASAALVAADTPQLFSFSTADGAALLPVAIPLAGR